MRAYAAGVSELMKRSFFSRAGLVALAAFFTLALSSCTVYYYFPEHNFAGRPNPPSLLAQRVLVAIQNPSALTQGKLEILDGQLDLRTNIQNTVPEFDISGYSGDEPYSIQNFPEQTTGFVYAIGDGSFKEIDYGTEKQAAAIGGLPGISSSVMISGDFRYIFASNETFGYLTVLDRTTGTNTRLNLPNIYKVATNVGGTVGLAMTRNSNSIYRVAKLNVNQYLTAASAIAAIPGAVDCEPLNLPVFCAVTVPGTYDRPAGAYFSLDGNTVYILNCGPECGGTKASVSFLPIAGLNINNLATTVPNPNVPTVTVPIPGGATDAISDGTTLYVSGQQLQPDGNFAGFMTTVNLASQKITGTYSISDGNHTKMLFADDNSLWIGSQLCATGERFAQAQAHPGSTANQYDYNCLTRFDLTTKAALVVPSVPIPLHLQNSNADPNYYGDLTGICWVQNWHKVYTAYGGQIHAFNTIDGSERDNTNITVQGTAMDVAYMDALTNAAD